MLKEIPFNVTYVIFQHSSDRKCIYAGVMERGSMEAHVKKSARSPTPCKLCTLGWVDEGVWLGLGKTIYICYRLCLQL